MVSSQTLRGTNERHRAGRANPAERKTKMKTTKMSTKELPSRYWEPGYEDANECLTEEQMAENVKRFYELHGDDELPF